MDTKVADLTKRYGIKQGALYLRLKQLGIKPRRVQYSSYLTEKQLALMDQLDDFLKTEKGSIDDFRKTRIRGSEKQKSVALKTTEPQITIATTEPETATDYLQYFIWLEDASARGWLLRSSELALLLNLPFDVVDKSKDFADAGFWFTSSGYRGDGQKAWRVSKH